MQETRDLERGNGTGAHGDLAAAMDAPRRDPGMAEDEIAPEELEQIWARRAANLAKLPDQDETGEQTTLLLIRLGRELYGLDARHIDRIEPVNNITRVPRVPNWVTGVTNLRGRVLSVVDLVRFFGLPPASGDTSLGRHTDGDDNGQETTERRLVVVNTPEIEIALLVDDVLAIETLPAKWVQETVGTVRGLRPEYVRGVTRRRKVSEDTTEGNKALLTVLELSALLADERLIIHEEVV